MSNHEWTIEITYDGWTTIGVTADTEDEAREKAIEIAMTPDYLNDSVSVNIESIEEESLDD